MTGKILSFNDELNDEGMELFVRPSVVDSEIELQFCLNEHDGGEERLKIRIDAEKAAFILKEIVGLAEDVLAANKSKAAPSENQKV